MPKRKPGTRALAAASIGALCLLLLGVATPEARAEYGDVVINNYSDKAGMRPVVFPHWFHRVRFACKACHADLGFQFRAGGNDINMVKIIDGQFCGGLAQGIGGALYEELVYDSQGQIATATFMDYLLPTAAEMPLEIVNRILELTPSTANPLGVKGGAEAGISGALAVIGNAVADALAPLGGHVTALPLKPDRVLALCRGGNGAQREHDTSAGPAALLANPASRVANRSARVIVMPSSARDSQPGRAPRPAPGSSVKPPHGPRRYRDSGSSISRRCPHDGRRCRICK